MVLDMFHPWKSSAYIAGLERWISIGPGLNDMLLTSSSFALEAMV